MRLPVAALLAACVLALVAASGCTTPPGVLARLSSKPAEARLMPDGVGALGEVGLTESNASGVRKMAARRGFVVTKAPKSGEERWELDISDYPTNSARLYMVLEQYQGRLYVTRCDYTARGESEEEEWTLDPKANEDGSTCALHTDDQGRSHVSFSLGMVSGSWPEHTTLKGVIVSTK
ncbi:MAG: hypothetical protein AB7K09_03745 [Planctomycetota bacterium]